MADVMDNTATTEQDAHEMQPLLPVDQDHASDHALEVKKGDDTDRVDDDNIDVKTVDSQCIEMDKISSTEDERDLESASSDNLTRSDEAKHSTYFKFNPKEQERDSVAAINDHVPNGKPHGLYKGVEGTEVEIEEILKGDGYTSLENENQGIVGDEGYSNSAYRQVTWPDGTDYNEDGDIDYDEPNYIYQDPLMMEEFICPNQVDDNPRRLTFFPCSYARKKKFDKLCFYIHYHEVNQMERILNQESEVDQAKLLVMKDDNGLSCLMNSIIRQSVHCIKALIERFKNLLPVFDANEIDPLNALETKEKTNLFHLAAEHATDKDIIDLVESCPLNDQFVDKEDCDQVTPLIVACQMRNVDMIHRLVKEKRAKIDHFDKHGKSPIYYAAKCECASTLTMFLKEGSSDREYEQLFTAKELYGGMGTILQALLQSESPNNIWQCFKDEREQKLIRECLKTELKDDKYFLHKVCSKPLVDLVRMAVNPFDENSRLLDTFDEKGMTPLMRATEEQQLEIVKLIVDHEYGRHTVSLGRRNNQQTALMIACKKDYHEIAKSIMQQSDVRLDDVDHSKRNIFHIAATRSNVLKEIIDVCSANDKYSDYKVHLEKKDESGYASLHYAAAVGSPKNVQLLLDHGVPYDLANPRTTSLALHEATITGNLSTVKVLVNFVEVNHGEEAKKKLIDAVDRKLQTCLHLAASIGKWKTVSYLLENDATIKCDYEMETPLHLAAANGCTKTVERLLRCKPSAINNENRVGETPAMFAAVEGRTEMLQLLLNSGAKLYVEKNNGKNPKTCLEWAVDNNNSQTASAILDQNDWKTVVEKSSIGADGLLAKMVKSMPAVACKVFDKCITVETNKKDKRQTVYDFFSLQTVEGEQSNESDVKNKPQKQKKVSAMQTLKAIIRHSRDECLRHSLVQEFLRQWENRARKWYWSNLLLYIVFLISLTTYIGLVRNGASSGNSLSVYALAWICGFCTCVRLVKECFKLLYKRLAYFCDFMTYTELVLYICVFIFIPHSEKNDHQWQAGAIAIFLAWINFAWLLRWFSAYGIYVIMVKEIFVTFLKALLPVLLLIIAFAMMFFVLLYDDKEETFKSISVSMLSSFAMMAGDINYHEGFLERTGGRFGTMVITFWVISVMVMTILIMNLLTALAVGDIGKILRRSLEVKQLQQATFIVDFERLLNKLPFLGASFVEPLTLPLEQSRLTKFLVNLRETVCPKFDEQGPVEEKTKCQCPALMEQLVEVRNTLAVMQRNPEDVVLKLPSKKNKPSIGRPRRNSRRLLEQRGSSQRAPYTNSL